MRRALASADHRSKSPSVGAEKGRLHSLEVVGPMEGYGAVAILWRGAIGSLVALTTCPGGVRIPGAPLIN